MATMKELREECAKLGITPGRSLAECERRIAEHKANNWHPGSATTPTDAVLITEVNPMTGRRSVIGMDFAKAAHPCIVVNGDTIPADSEEAQCVIEAAEQQAMAEYSAEMRRMDEIGETAWLAEQFQAPEPPRMSRTARMLCDCTAICGSLARNPLVYGGDPQRHDYAIMGGWQQAPMMQGRAMARGLVGGRR